MAKLTKKERKELKKIEETQRQEAGKKQKKKKFIGIILGVIAFIVLAWALIAYAINQNGLEIPAISSKDVLIGPKNAKVSLVEYADFDCPACAQYSPTIEKLLSENKKSFSFTYRFFPLTNIHKNARASAQAAYAAYKQEKFLEMISLLYKNQEAWGNLESPEEVFINYAKEIGLNSDQFIKDYHSKEVSQFILDSENQALNLGLYYTPTFFINGKLVETQTPQQLEELIQKEINRT